MQLEGGLGCGNCLQIAEFQRPALLLGKQFEEGPDGTREIVGRRRGRLGGKREFT